MKIVAIGLLLFFTACVTDNSYLHQYKHVDCTAEAFSQGRNLLEMIKDLPGIKVQNYIYLDDEKLTVFVDDTRQLDHIPVLLLPASRICRISWTHDFDRPALKIWTKSS